MLDAALTSTGRARAWEPNWPAACCDCGGPVARTRSLVTSVTKRATIGEQMIKLALNGIPYCAAHGDGVGFGIASFARRDSGTGFGLLFKSMACRDAFFALNRGSFLDSANRT